MRSSGTSVRTSFVRAVVAFGFALTFALAAPAFFAERFSGFSFDVSLRAVRAMAPPALLTADFPFRGICFSFRNSQWLPEEVVQDRRRDAVPKTLFFECDAPDF